jgi:hypothetical protein
MKRPKPCGMRPKPPRHASASRPPFLPDRNFAAI